MSRGKFIVIEGMDGSGKGTQVELLKEELGYGNTLYLNNISNSPIGLAIRELLKSISISHNKFMHNNVGLACLYLSELILITSNIEDILAEGRDVIMDRYYYSTMAYAGHTLEDGIVIETIIKDMLKPDLVIYLDIDVKESLKRITSRNGTLEFFEKEDKLNVIKDNYESIFKKGDTFDKTYTKVIDATLEPLEILKIIVNNINLIKGN